MSTDPRLFTIWSTGTDFLSFPGEVRIWSGILMESNTTPLTWLTTVVVDQQMRRR